MKTTRSKSIDRRQASSERVASPARKNKSTSAASKKSSKSPAKKANRSTSRSPARSKKSNSSSSKGAKVFTKKELSDKKQRSSSKSKSPKRDKTPAKRTLRSASTTSNANSSSSPSKPSNKGPLVSTIDRLKQEMDELTHTEVVKKKAAASSSQRRHDEIDLTDLDKHYGLRKRAAPAAPSSSTPYRSISGRGGSCITITKRLSACSRNLSKSFCNKIHGCASMTIGRFIPAKCMSRLCPAKWRTTCCGYMRFNRAHVIKFFVATFLLVAVLAGLNKLNLIGFDVFTFLGDSKNQAVKCVSTTFNRITSGVGFCAESFKGVVVNVAGKISETVGSITKGGGGAAKSE